MYFVYFFFFFNDTATTEIYTYGHTLSLHDALPILGERAGAASAITPELRALAVSRYTPKTMVHPPAALAPDGRFVGREHRFALRVYFADPALSGVVYHAKLGRASVRVRVCR